MKINVVNFVLWQLKDEIYTLCLWASWQSIKTTFLLPFILVKASAIINPAVQKVFGHLVNICVRRKTDPASTMHLDKNTNKAPDKENSRLLLIGKYFFDQNTEN